MSAAKIVDKLLEMEDPKDFLDRAFTLDINQLKQRLIAEVGLGSVVVHVLNGSPGSGSLSLYVYAAKEPASTDKWDRANRIAGSEEGAITRVVFDWIESFGGFPLDRETLTCPKFYKKFAQYGLLRFLLKPANVPIQIVGDDNERTIA